MIKIIPKKERENFSHQEMDMKYDDCIGLFDDTDFFFQDKRLIVVISDDVKEDRQNL